MIQELIDNAIAQNPYRLGRYGVPGVGSGAGVSGQRYVRGGGRVRVPAGTHVVHETIKLPPLVTLDLSDGAHLEAANDFQGYAMIWTSSTMAKDGTPAEPGDDVVFSRTRPAIVGGQLHGEGNCATAIDLHLTTNAVLREVLAEGFTGDQIVLRQAQYTRLVDVVSIGSGGYDVRVGTDPDTPASFGSNDTMAAGLVVDGGGLGGLAIFSAATGEWGMVSAQFHEGPGILLQASEGEVIGHVFIAPHLEANHRHVEVLEGVHGLPRDCVLVGGHWIAGNGTSAGNGVESFPVDRFLVNEGVHTVVLAPGGLNNPTEAPAGFVAFQQHPQRGGLRVIDPFVPRSQRGTVQLLDDPGGLAVVERHDAGPWPTSGYWR